jgi:hypothetical protein
MPRRNRGQKDGAGNNLIARLQAELVRSKKQESHHSRGAFGHHLLPRRSMRTASGASHAGINPPGWLQRPPSEYLSAEAGASARERNAG